MNILSIIVVTICGLFLVSLIVGVIIEQISKQTKQQVDRTRNEQFVDTIVDLLTRYLDWEVVSTLPEDEEYREADHKVFVLVFFSGGQIRCTYDNRCSPIVYFADEEALAEMQQVFGEHAKEVLECVKFRPI